MKLLKSILITTVLGFVWSSSVLAKVEPRYSSGIWDVVDYEDTFGEKTGGSYITNILPIVGTFSNQVVNNKRLFARIIVYYDTLIAFQLLEYSGAYPVKGDKFPYDRYLVKVKAGDGSIHTFYARLNNLSDEIRLDEEYSKELHKILCEGGKVMFRLSRGGGESSYSIDIDNTDGYEDAYNKIVE